MQYHIPNAIYDPNSPFNILGILFFGRFLGREDTPYPTSNNDGTYIQIFCVTLLFCLESWEA
jgi:hypothetical protein